MNKSFDVLYSVYKKIDENAKVAFLAAFAFGFFTHLAIITNKLTNWDDIAVTPSAGGGIYFGRWLMEKVFYVFDKWGSETLNGTLSILLLAISIAVMVEILGLKSKTAIILISSLIVSFPSVLSNLTFVFMSPTFFLSILIAVIAVYCTVQYRYGFLFASIIMIFSMAIYQAYFSLAASLLLMVLMGKIINGEEIKNLWKEGFKYLSMLALSMILYLLSIKITGVELSSYRGMDNLGSAGVMTYVIAIVRAYHRVLQYFVTGQPSYVFGFLSVMMYLCAALVLGAVILSLVYMKKRDVSHCLAFLAIALIFPFAVSLVYVMAPEEEHASTIMTFAYCMVPVLPIYLFEELSDSMTEKSPKLMSVFSVIMCIIMLLTCFAQYRMTNKAYYRTEVALERMTNYYNRLIYRIEQTEGFEYGDKIAIVGDFYPENLPVSTYEMEKSNWDDLEGLSDEEGMFSLTIRNYFIRIHLGIDTLIYHQDELQELSKSELVADMPCYPEDGCVQKIDDVWVLKVAE
ncbi:MAG: glucosyltransferase domain-containing protein [Butyrivibrio sp.]|nr:glucosyltransferase domain-containing protein [Butyrivibrio sp.]